MRPCIYCSNPVDGSEQHIIPSAIGGQWESSAIVCSACNLALGNSLDKSLASRFAELNNRLAIMRGRRGVAGPIRQVATDGTAYDVKPGGLARPSGSSRSFNVCLNADGTGGEITAVASTERETQQMIEGYLKKRGFKATSSKITENWEVPSPEFNSTMPLDATVLRATTKIGFEALAVNVARDLVMQEGFDHIRSYIKDGQEDGRLIAFVDDTTESRETPDLGRVDHSVVVFCNAETRTVRASIVLYGMIPITALLSDVWDGPSSGWEHRVDPLTGQMVKTMERTDVPDVSAEQIREHAVALTSERVAAHLQSSLQRLIPVAAERFIVMLVKDAAARELHQHVDVEANEPVGSQAIAAICEGVFESVVRAEIELTPEVIELLRLAVRDAILSFIVTRAKDQ